MSFVLFQVPAPPPATGPPEAGFRRGLAPTGAVFLRYSCGIAAVYVRYSSGHRRRNTAPHPHHIRPGASPTLAFPTKKGAGSGTFMLCSPTLPLSLFYCLPDKTPDVFRVFRAGDLKPATTTAKTPDDGNAAGHADDDCIPLSSIPTTHFPFQAERFFFDFRINGADTAVLWHSVRHSLSETDVPACQTPEIRLIFPPPAQHTFPVL